MVDKEKLESMTRKELCDYCRSNGIKGYSGKTKAERIKLVLDFYKKPKLEKPKKEIKKEPEDNLKIRKEIIESIYYNLFLDTKDLSEVLNLPMKKVYANCRWLEKNGLIYGEATSGTGISTERGTYRIRSIQWEGKYHTESSTFTNLNDAFKELEEKMKAKKPSLTKYKKMGKKQLKTHIKKEISEGRQRIVVKIQKEKPKFKLIKLWHSTTPDRIPSIMKKGLIAGYKKPPGQEWLPEYHGKGSYFHTHFPDHELANGIMGYEVYIGVLEFYFKVNLDKVIAEEEGYKGLKGLDALEEGGGIVYLEKRVSPYYITKIYFPYVKGKSNTKAKFNLYESIPELKEYIDKISWKGVS